MNGGIPTAETCRSREQLFKTLQETPDAVAGNIAELLHSHREQSPESGPLARDTTPVQTRKRPFDATLSDPSPSPERPHAAFHKGLVDSVHPGPRLASVHAFVSEWLESVESHQEKRCRSDSHLHFSESDIHLHFSDDDPITRQLTRSAPEMASRRDADRFVVPPVPNSYVGSSVPSGLTSPARSSGYSSGKKTLVEDPLYRCMNLAANNIYIRFSCEQFPDDIANLINYVRQDRGSPGPSPDEVRQDRALEELGWAAPESDVARYFQAKIFPDYEPGDCLKRSDRQPMAKHTVPHTGTKFRVSTPVPDLLYGYNRRTAFPHQQALLISMESEMVATNQPDLLYPFFIIEFKGDDGSMLVATNQCLGGSASCVNVAETLNRRLRQHETHEIRPVDSAAFSIAMNGSEARLYISWKQNERDYFMAKVKSFLLQDPEQFIEFRKYVRNIFDWGMGTRLIRIQSALGTLEGSRKGASD